MLFLTLCHLPNLIPSPGSHHPAVCSAPVPVPCRKTYGSEQNTQTLPIQCVEGNRHPRLRASLPPSKNPQKSLNPKLAGSFRGVLAEALHSKILTEQKLKFSLLVCPEQGILETWVQICLLPALKNDFEHTFLPRRVHKAVGALQ